jgi:hypothetical protein
MRLAILAKDLMPHWCPARRHRPQTTSKSLKNGGRTRARTLDLVIKSPLLYQLSYASYAGVA